MIFRFEHELWRGAPGQPGAASTVIRADGKPGDVWVCVRVLVGETPDRLQATGSILLTPDEWARFRVGVEDFEMGEVHFLGPGMKSYCGQLAELPADASRFAMTRELDGVTCADCKGKVAAYVADGNDVHVFGYRRNPRPEKPWRVTACGRSTDDDLLCVSEPMGATCKECVVRCLPSNERLLGDPEAG